MKRKVLISILEERSSYIQKWANEPFEYAISAALQALANDIKAYKKPRSVADEA